MGNHKTFYRIDGGRIEIPESIFTILLNYKQNNLSKKESGGILLGRHLLESKDIVIDNITVPMRGDRRTRYSFNRGKTGHQRVVGKTWIESKGTCNYLGEWHTHPEKNPSPSMVDFKNWERIMKQTIYDGYNLFFLIVGIDTINIWEGQIHSNEFYKLKEYK